MDGQTVDKGDEPAQQPLLQRLLSKEFQTVLALFSALGFVVGFRDVSRLARALLGGFDKVVLAAAKALKDWVHLPFELSGLKIFIIYIPIVVFIVTGLIRFARTRKLFENRRDVVTAFLCQSVLFAAWSIKFLNFANEGNSSYDAAHNNLLLVSLVFAATVIFYMVLPFPLFLFFRYGRKLPDLKAFLLTIGATIFICCLIVFVIAFWLGFSTNNTAMTGLTMGAFVVFFGLIIMLPSFILPQLMLFNPHRLRQVTLFVVVIIALAFASKFVDGAFSFLGDPAEPDAAAPAGDTPPDPAAGTPQTPDSQ